MSLRGRRSTPRVRRPLAPPAAARDETASETSEALGAEAERLVEAFGPGAYREARRRQREARASGAGAHWAHVASLIARRRPGERDTAGWPARAELEAELAVGGENAPAPWPIRFFEADPLDEFAHLLAAKPQFYRLQFFGAGADLGPHVLRETEIEAPDASGAIRVAAKAAWPARAVGLRLLDLEGREIFERLKADL